MIRVGMKLRFGMGSVQEDHGRTRVILRRTDGLVVMWLVGKSWRPTRLERDNGYTRTNYNRRPELRQ